MSDYRFAPTAKDDRAAGTINLSENPESALLAACIAEQQAAGFGDYLDLRRPSCQDCGAPGFNTGWGYWRFGCGAEVLSDGEPGEPCGGSDSAPTPEGQEK